MCCVLGTPLEVWEMEKASGVGRCSQSWPVSLCETSYKHLGRDRAIRGVIWDLGKAHIKPRSKKGREENWEDYRLVSFTPVPGNVMGQVFLSHLQALEG